MKPTLKNSVCLSAIIFIWNISIAQNENVSIPSADATAKAKSGDIPVNYNNGTSQVSIPIYTIQDYDLTVPVGLSYQSGGLKVNEISSSVGAGWSLAAGGAITRVVRDLPDDLYAHPNNPDGPVGYIQFKKTPEEFNENAVVDHTPDIYYFNVQGFSGSFTLDEDGHVIQKYSSDVRIEYALYQTTAIEKTLIEYWKISLPNGFECYLGKYDEISGIDFSYSYDQEYLDDQQLLWQYSYANCWNGSFMEHCLQFRPVVSSWNIIRVVSPQRHSITYLYDIERYLEYAISEQRNVIISPCEFNEEYNPSENITYQEIYSNRIKSISTEHYLIEFGYQTQREDLDGNTHYTVQSEPVSKPKELNSINIFAKDKFTTTCLKKFNLGHFYSTAPIEGYNYVTNWSGPSVDPGEYPDLKRLFLETVTESSCDETIQYNTSLTYYGLDSLSRRLSHAQDFWGYYNGQNQNMSLMSKVYFDGSCLPTIDCRASLWNKFADRDPRKGFARAGSLKEITYPTGANVALNYELNQIRGKEFNKISEEVKSRSICSTPSGTCTCNLGIDVGDQTEFTEIDYSHYSAASINIDYRYESCNNVSGKIKIYSKKSSDNPLFYVLGDELSDIGPGVYNKKYTNQQIKDLFNWEEGEQYDIKIITEGNFEYLKSRIIVEHFEPSLINKDIGGLRVISTVSNDLTKIFKYTTDEELEEPESTMLVDFQLCNLHLCNPAQPNYIDTDQACNQQSVTGALFVHVPCDGELFLHLQYEQTDDCYQEPIQIEFSWIEVPGGIEHNSIVFSTPSLTGSKDYLHATLVDAGLVPGKNYNFTFRILNQEYGTAKAWLRFTPNNEVNYTPKGDYISSGEMITYPFMLTYMNSPLEFDTELGCESNFYILTNNSRTQFQSTSGGHVLYKRVLEEYYQGETYYGRREYIFDNYSEPGAKPIENRYSAINPIIAGFPPPSEFLRSPRYGLLIESNTYDAQSNLEVKEEFDYRIKKAPSETYFYGEWPKCNNNGVFKLSSKYYSPNYTILLNSTKKTELGIVSITKNFYRADFKHHNPIITESYVEGHDDKIKTEFKYAQEVSDELLLANHMYSIPLETIVNEGYGGGSKIVYTQENGRILQKSGSRRLDQPIPGTDEVWKEVSVVNEFTGDGLPKKVRTISAGGETTLTWVNGLLESSQFGDRITTYTYYPTRLLFTTLDYQGIYSSNYYDSFFRLQKNISKNGTVESTYSYKLDEEDGENSIRTVTSFPGDPFNLPDWISDELIDIDGRSKFLTQRGYTYSGNDYTTGSRSGVFGELLESCDPNKGGCDIYEYTLSPMRRPVKMTPAGSSKSVYFNKTANDETVALGDIYYPPNTLVKLVTIDENGHVSENYSNMRGQTVLVCIDPDGLNIKTHYRYDLRGNIIKVYPPGSAGELDLANFSYTYQIDGLLASKIIPDEGVYQYSYNSRETVKTESKPNGFTTEYFYDGTYPDFITSIEENGLTVKSISPYNDDIVQGWVGSISLTTGTEMLTTSYPIRDDLGRVLSETQEYIDGDSKFSYAYDYAGNRRKLQREHTYLNSKTIEYSYQYDMPLGHRINEVIFDFGGIHSLSKYVYDDNDWLQSDCVGDGIHTITYDYNARGWLEEINGVEPPPLAPKDDCIVLADPQEPDPFPIPFPNCIRGANGIQIRILYNCEKMHSLEPTSIYVTYIGALGDDSFLIPLNGATGYTNDYEDRYEVLLNLEDLDQLGVILQTLFSECLPENASIIPNFTLDQIINQILDQFDEEEENSPLFGLKLHYYVTNGELEAPAQYNGNTAWMEWQVAGEHYQTYGFQYDAANRLTLGKYQAKVTRCKTTPADYDVSFGYDSRGNFTTLNRNGFKGISTDGVPHYGAIDQLEYEYECNQLKIVTDDSDVNRGYLGTNSHYTYEHGLLVTETGARSLDLSYNFNNQPTLIKSSGKNAIRNVWSAGGTLLKQIEYGANEVILHERLYHDGIEYLDGKIQSINHGEGRYVFEYETDGSLKRNYHEFMISDNLGNTRVRFADLNGDKKINIHDEGPGQEKELFGSFHYYPYGLKMQGIFHNQEATECRYQYNGIEFLSHAGINVNLATWRTNDPSIARWWQVDPNAESLYSLSPFNSMNNNPITYNDPKGDFPPLLIPVIGAAAGILGNGISNSYAGNPFFRGAVGAAFFGAWGAAGAYAIGGMITIPGISGEFARAGAHGIFGGVTAEGQGSNFGTGFLSGGLGSLSAGAFSSLGDLGSIASSTLMGGVGAKLSGGDFWQGAVTGFSVGAFNHAFHEGPGDPPTKEEMKIYLAGEFLAGRISQQDYINAIVLVDNGPWGLFQQVASNNKYDIAMTILPIRPLGMLGRYFASLEQLAESGTVIAKVVRDAPRLVKVYGGSASDWRKMTSATYTGRDGFKFSTHWYENIVTGVKTEYKTVIGR